MRALPVLGQSRPIKTGENIHERRSIAMLTGLVPSDDEIRACARDGVETFLSRPNARSATREKPLALRRGGRWRRNYEWAEFG